jgi:hypothetical protein
MTDTTAPALATPAEAKDLLSMDDEELAAAVSDGTLRRVSIDVTGAFVVGADIDAELAASDPRALAKLIGRDGAGTSAVHANLTNIPRL